MKPTEADEPAVDESETHGDANVVFDLDIPEIAAMIATIRKGASDLVCKHAIEIAFRAASLAPTVVAVKEEKPKEKVVTKLFSFKNVEGPNAIECGLLLFMKKYGRNCTCKDIEMSCEHNLSDNMMDNIKVLAAVAHKNLEQMTSPIKFSTVMTRCTKTLHQNVIDRTGKIRTLVEKYSSEIEWNTCDGTPGQKDWDDCNWMLDPPSYELRMCHSLELIRTMNKVTPRYPEARDLPMYCRRADRTGWDGFINVDNRRKSAVSKLADETISESQVPEWIRKKTEMWLYLKDNVKPHRIDETGAVYILMIEDPDTAHGQWKSQAYVGSARTSVKQRWFASGGNDAHLGCINRILGHATTSKIQSNTPTLLVDVKLAQLWTLYGTWTEHAMLFVVETKLGENTEARQDELMKQFNLTSSRNGMNAKPSGRVKKGDSSLDKTKEEEAPAPALAKKTDGDL